MRGDAGMVTELARLRRRVDNLVKPERGVRVVASNVSNPPTDAELDALFGTAMHAGFMALVEDVPTGATVWLVAWVGSAWWYEQLTKAV